MTEVFEIKEPHYNLHSEASHFKRENVKSTNYGIQSVRHLGPKIWWVLFDLICIRTICLSFQKLYLFIHFLVGVN